jgi:hypothetical protein
VFAVGDDDGEGAGDAFEFARAGAGDDFDRHVAAACIHGGEVLEDEAARLVVELAGDGFDGDVAGCSGFGVAGGVHLSFGRGFEIAVDGFVDGEAGNSGDVGGSEWLDFDFEGSASVMHGSFLWRRRVLSDGDRAAGEDDGETERDSKIRHSGDSSSCSRRVHS